MGVTEAGGVAETFPSAIRIASVMVMHSRKMCKVKCRQTYMGFAGVFFLPIRRIKKVVKSKMYGKSTYAIAAEEDCDHKAVLKSLQSAQKKIDKELAKRGY